MDLAELQQNLEILESRYSELVDQRDGKVLALEAELAERHKQCEAQAKRIKSLEAEAQATAEMHSCLQAELLQHRKQLSAREQEHAELQARAQVLEASVSQAQAERDALAQQRQAAEARAQELQAERSEIAEQLASQGEALQLSEERLQAIPLLQSELQESRQRVVQLCQVLEEQQASEQAWRASVESELYELRDQRARLQEEVDTHVGSLRELEVLRTECARRYQALRLSEEQATKIRRLERRCLELEEMLIQVQSKEQEHDSLLPAASPESTERLQQLEQELKEARDEAELLLEQLFLVQEELEHYFLLSQEQGLAERQPSPASPPANRQEDAAAINSNRGRLLSAV